MLHDALECVEALGRLSCSYYNLRELFKDRWCVISKQVCADERSVARVGLWSSQISFWYMKIISEEFLFAYFQSVATALKMALDKLFSLAPQHSLSGVLPLGKYDAVIICLKQTLTSVYSSPPRIIMQRALLLTLRIRRERTLLQLSTYDYNISMDIYLKPSSLAVRNYEAPL